MSGLSEAEQVRREQEALAREELPPFKETAADVVQRERRKQLRRKKRKDTDQP